MSEHIKLQELIEYCKSNAEYLSGEGDSKEDKFAATAYRDVIDKATELLSNPPAKKEEGMTDQDIKELAMDALKGFYAKAPYQKQEEADFLQDVAEINWIRGYKQAMEAYKKQAP